MDLKKEGYPQMMKSCSCVIIHMRFKNVTNACVLEIGNTQTVFFLNKLLLSEWQHLEEVVSPKLQLTLIALLIT